MLEVVFNPVDREVMKMFKKIEMGKLKERLEESELEGIIMIGFNLDIGDISGEIDGQGRQDVYDLWAINENDLSRKKDHFIDQRTKQDYLISQVKKGKSIRIWKRNSPHSLCGFYYLCDLLREIDCSIKLVSLAESIVEGDYLVSYKSWGEILPYKLNDFLVYQRELAPIEKIVNSGIWKGLVKDNAPMRAMINGKIVSVAEDFYDFLIRDRIPKGDFKLVNFIGNLMSESFRPEDFFYYLRVKKMIENKELIIVENEDPTLPFMKILRKNK